MKKSVRKLLATLLALCLLCTVLPLGAMVSAETKTEMTDSDNRISNGDFECWKNNGSGQIQPVYWHGGAFGEGETYGKYARVYDITSTETKSMYQTIAVDNGTTYKLTFKAKAAAGDAFTVNVVDANGEKPLQRACGATAEWSTYVFLFRYDGTLQEATLRFTAEEANADIYIDDVTLDCDTANVTETTGVSYDGYILDGDFESGSTNYWTVSGGAAEAYNGEYMLKATTSSKYSSVAKQIIMVEENTDYVLDVNALYVGTASSAQARVHVYSGTSDTDLFANYYWTIYPDTESTHRFSFNSGANTLITINIQQSVSDGNIYYDDFVMMKASDLVDPDESTVVNMLTNGDFETDSVDSSAANWKHYDSNYPSLVSNEDAYTGSQSVKLSYRQSRFVLYQDVTVEANTDYTVTLYYRYTATSSTRVYRLGAYTTSSNGNVGTGGGTLIDSTATEVNTVITNTEWTQLTYTFNSGDNTTVRIGVSGISSSAKIKAADGFMLIDDIVMPNPNTNSGDSGDSGEEPEVPDVNTGYYFYSNQAYKTLYEFDLTELAAAQAGKTYKITFSARAITNGFRLVINDEVVDEFYWSEDIRSWKTIEIYHRVSASEMRIALRTLGNAGVETNFYISETILVEEIPDEEVNLLEHGGNSAMEMDDTYGGLAFLFSANIENISFTPDDSKTEHKYTVYRYDEENPAIGHPFTNEQFLDDPYDYTVVRMGAIVSNKEGEVADSDLVIENTADKSNVINIVGSKAMKDMCDDTHYVYGVRVTNVPESYFGRTIYARPYIIVKAGEREITLYGEMVSASYNDYMGEVTE